MRGEPGPVSRRGWRAEGLEARERESSSEPRQDAEANVRRNGSGSPRASQNQPALDSSYEELSRCGAGLSRRAGHPGPAAYDAAGFLPAEPVRAAPAYWAEPVRDAPAYGRVITVSVSGRSPSATSSVRPEVS